MNAELRTSTTNQIRNNLYNSISLQNYVINTLQKEKKVF